MHCARTSPRTPCRACGRRRHALEVLGCTVLASLVSLVATTLAGRLLALPPSLEGTFTRNAPDFWSIRSSHVTLRAPTANTHPTQTTVTTTAITPPRMTILHLAQPRIGAPTLERSTPILSALWRDLDTLRSDPTQPLAPDLVCITGDVAHAGTLQDYELAEAHLHRPLINETHLGPSRIIWTPGDLDGLDGYGSQLSNLAHLAQPDLEQAIQDPRQRLSIFERFLPYDVFLRVVQEAEVLGQTPSFATAHLAAVRFSRIGVASINTAWLSQRRPEDRGHLRVSAAQLDHTQRQLDDLGATFRVALMHHPPSWLNASLNALEPPLRDRFHLLLTCAQTPNAELIDPGHDTQAPILATPPLLPESPDDAPGYTWITLNGDVPSEVIHRRYDAASQTFVEASRHTFQLGPLTAAPTPPPPPADDPQDTLNDRVEYAVLQARGNALTHSQLSRLRRNRFVNKRVFPHSGISDAFRGVAIAEYLNTHSEHRDALVARLPAEGIEKVLVEVLDIASSLDQQGKYEPNKALLERALKNPISNPRLKLALMRSIALNLKELGELEEAKELQLQTLDAHQRILGPDHPDTLAAIANMAITLSELGELQEAKALELQVLDARQRILGPDHSDTLAAIANMAVTLVELGELQEGKTLGLQVLDARQRILGPEHPNTLSTMGNMASTLSELGELQEAKALGLQVLDARQRILGPEHPDTLNTMGNMAVTLMELGELQEAEHLLTPALNTLTQKLGPHHPLTLAQTETLAHIHQKLGKLDQAHAECANALTISRDRLGPQHPITTHLQRRLAEILDASDQTEAADALRSEMNWLLDANKNNLSRDQKQARDWLNGLEPTSEPA